MEHFEKNLAMTLAGYDVQPTVILYDILMREKVKKISGTYPVDIGAKWDSQVWKSIRNWHSNSHKTYYSAGNARSLSLKRAA